MLIMLLSWLCLCDPYSLVAVVLCGCGCCCGALTVFSLCELVVPVFVLKVDDVWCELLSCSSCSTDDEDEFDVIKGVTSSLVATLCLCLCLCLLTSRLEAIG